MALPLSREAILRLTRQYQNPNEEFFSKRQQGYGQAFPRDVRMPTVGPPALPSAEGWQLSTDPMTPDTTSTMQRENQRYLQSLQGNVQDIAPDARPWHEGGPPDIKPPLGKEEPWMQAALGQFDEEAADMDRRGAMLEAARIISEGLGNIGSKPLTAGGVLLGQKEDPYIAEGIRVGQAQLENELTPEARDVYSKSLGMDIPEGTTKDEIAPLMRGMISPKDIYREEKRAERWGEYKELRGVDQALRERRTLISEERLGRMDAGGRKLFSNYNQTLDLFDRIEKAYGGAGAGVVRTRLNRVAQYLGLDDPSLTALEAHIVDMVGSYLTAKTGAQRGMTEVAWLKRALPDAALKPETFIRLLKEARERFTAAARFDLDMYKQQGFKIPELTGMAEGAEASESAGGVNPLREGHIRVIDREGKRWQMPMEKWGPRAEEAGYRQTDE